MVHAVVVPITDPHSRDASLGGGALELIGGTGDLRAIPLVLSVSAIILSVTAEYPRNTTVRHGTLELAG